MAMTITGYDTIELEQIEPEDSIPERVWMPDDHLRLSRMIEGKTATDAVKFIRDTEGVPKRSAEKVMNEMEANGTIAIVTQGRTKTIQTNDMI